MQLSDLAFFGGLPVFQSPRSTSNLFRPNKELFMRLLERDLASGDLIDFPYVVSAFEQKMAEWHGARYCVAVCNGLWGLVLAINEMRLKSRTEMVMPSMTYRRMGDIAAWLKLIPHYCDVDIETAAMTVQAAESCISTRTALLLVPHPIVNLCDIESMLELGQKHGIPVLFDSVEATYAMHHGQPVGSFGTEVFSVHASKFLNGFEGGYITTNDGNLADKLRAARNYGLNENGVRITSGINAQLPAPHAAMALACLDDVPRQVENNKQRYLSYRERLRDIPSIRLIEYSMDERRSYKNIIVELSDDWLLSREEILMILQKENMMVRPYYDPPLHLKKTSYPVVADELPNTLRLMKKRMLLPCGEFVSLDDIRIVADYLGFLYKRQTEIRHELDTVRKA